MKRPSGEICAPAIAISPKKRLRSMSGGCSAGAASGAAAPTSPATVNINSFIPTPGLLACKNRRPLVTKSLHAFRKILSVAELGLGVRLDRQLFGPRAGQLHIEDLFDALKRLGGTGGEAAGDGLRLRLQRCILHACP